MGSFLCFLCLLHCLIGNCVTTKPLQLYAKYISINLSIRSQILLGFDDAKMAAPPALEHHQKNLYVNPHPVSFSHTPDILIIKC
jgi:hypothetical protein